MRHRTWLLLGTLLIGALFLSPATADEAKPALDSVMASLPDNASDTAAAKEEKKPPNCSLCNLLNVPRDFLSDQFMGLSDQLDAFFSNVRTYEKLDKSFAELSLNTVTGEGMTPQYYGDTRVFLELPRTQKRLNLMFQSESDGELDGDNPDITPGSPDRQTTALALRGDVTTKKDWRVYADIGSEYRGFIDPFIRFTFYRDFQKEKWKLTWKEAVFRFGTAGNGITSGLRFDRPIDDRFHLRSTNQVIWYQTNNFWDRSHSLTLYQRMRYHSAAAYSIGQYTTSEPVDSVYYLQLRYKQLMHKTWMFYELIPEVLYKHSDNYAATPRFTLKISITLGNI